MIGRLRCRRREALAANGNCAESRAIFVVPATAQPRVPAEPMRERVGASVVLMTTTAIRKTKWSSTSIAARLPRLLQLRRGVPVVCTIPALRTPGVPKAISMVAPTLKSVLPAAVEAIIRVNEYLAPRRLEQGTRNGKC